MSFGSVRVELPLHPNGPGFVTRRVSDDLRRRGHVIRRLPRPDQRGGDDLLCCRHLGNSSLRKTSPTVCPSNWPVTRGSRPRTCPIAPRKTPSMAHFANRGQMPARDGQVSTGSAIESPESVTSGLGIGSRAIAPAEWAPSAAPGKFDPQKTENTRSRSMSPSPQNGAKRAASDPRQPVLTARSGALRQGFA